jgi:hypothetical protein
MFGLSAQLISGQRDLLALKKRLIAFSQLSCKSSSVGRPCSVSVVFTIANGEVYFSIVISQPAIA